MVVVERVDANHLPASSSCLCDWCLAQETEDSHRFSCCLPLRTTGTLRSRSIPSLPRLSHENPDDLLLNLSCVVLTPAQGQPRALSNFVRDEGGAAAAATSGLAKSGSGSKEDEEEAEGADAEGAPRWLWRGPGPPSLWYALEMSGREVGASMEVRLSVNSSAPLTTAAAVAASLSAHGGAGSPSAWHMGPRFSSPVGGSGGDAGGGGGGAPVVRSVPVEDSSSMNLSVAMRVGALPVVDPNGERKNNDLCVFCIRSVPLFAGYEFLSDGITRGPSNFFLWGGGVRLDILVVFTCSRVGSHGVGRTVKRASGCERCLVDVPKAGRARAVDPCFDYRGLVSGCSNRQRVPRSAVACLWLYLAT